jgi:hypothetical protein
MLLVVLYYLLFYLLFIYFRQFKSDRRSIVTQMIIAFLLLIVFFGFRDLSVLNDTSHYYSPLRDKMMHASSLGWFEINPYARFERGYQIFENFHAKLFTNPYSIIFTSSLIITIGNICFFRKLNGNYLFLSLFLMLNFQLLNQYSTVRQGIATVIIYYGILKLIQGSWKVFIISTLLASTFHVTSSILLVLLPCKYLDIRIGKKTIIFSVVFFFGFITFLLPHFIDFFSTDDSYVNTNSARESFPLASLVLVLMNVYLLYSSYRLNKISRIQIDKMYWVLGLICVFVSCVDISFQIVGRVAMYFFPFLVALYVHCVRMSNNVLKRKSLWLTFTLFFLWFVTYNLYKPEWYHLYPYTFMDFTKIFHGYEVR